MVVSGQEVMIGSVNLGMGMGILNLTEVAAVSEGGVLGTAFYSPLQFSLLTVLAVRMNLHLKL